MPPPEKQEAWGQQINQLTQRKEEVESELSQRSADFRKLRSESILTAGRLATQLPAKTALVDLLQFNRRIEDRKSDGSINIHLEQRLAAFVLQHDQPVAMIDLGLVEPVNDAIQEWRESYGSFIHGRESQDRARREAAAVALGAVKKISGGN